MSVITQPAGGSSAWRAAVIGLVAVLAVGMGVAAGSFLLNSRAGAGIGVAADYVPADAPFYIEMRVVPSEAQDAALRELIGRFPPIEGIDLDMPLHDQLVEKLDDVLAEESDLDLSWADDVAPWFDGTVAMAMTAFDADALANPMMAPDEVDLLVVLGVTDGDAARSVADRLLDRARDEGVTTEVSEHRGVRIVSGGSDGAVAITDDAVLLAPTPDGIRTALDLDASGDGSLSAAGAIDDLVARLPADWLAFGAYDLDEIMAASFEMSAEDSGIPSGAFDSLLADQSFRGAFTVSATGDAVAMDAVVGAPTGPLAVENADRGLAAEVPGDALYYADGGGYGASLAAMIEAFASTATAADPGMADEIETLEAALGAELPELVSWIDDVAIAAGWDGSEVYLGLVTVPNDIDAAERRLDQLAGFARLGTLDPASGITVEDREVAGATVTTIRWQDPNAAPDPFMPVPMPTGLAFEYTVTDDRAILGLGDRFVARVLELDPSDSLAEVDRYTDAVAELGGSSNAGVGWLDLAGIRAALEGTVLAAPEAEFFAAGYDEIRPWLEPFDSLVSVGRLDGEVLVQRALLRFD